MPLLFLKKFRKVLDKTPNAEQFLDMVMRNMPLKRLGTADDIARTALYLASAESAYTSGAVIPVDGGLAAMR